MEKIIQRLMSIIWIVLGMGWEYALYLELTNINIHVQGGIETAFMTVFLMAMAVFVGIFQLDELLKPFRD